MIFLMNDLWSSGTQASRNRFHDGPVPQPGFDFNVGRHTLFNPE
jgi:hypothetical protein